ncbi:hypothetical protein AVCANL279_08885 [Campylobacter canadensis]|uniref:Uncharacterized protein n=5 Tax=Campylobacter canadensis TaxID=449520 RepID=A0ABS7WTS6_9BACT|nr:hypothetical protein [Campylobacter canadensis]MBZ7988172.1 hypothetical protein [Campylobacter canadensis]MBZ7997422.1 hypothetical protein [Campylobacter canadensis]MBZ8004602.1 hypothetical protein [Campylobacter canadensis]
MQIDNSNFILRDWNDAYKDYKKAKTQEEESKYLKELTDIAVFKGWNDTQTNSSNTTPTDISNTSMFYIYMLDCNYAKLHPETFISKLLQNNDEAKDIKTFLKENALNNDYTANYDYKIKELFASNISIDDFKQKYLNRISELKQENLKNNIKAINKEINKTDNFKPIEAKSTNVRESMQDILKKIDINKIKDERDLLALILAYKNSENLYDKRV